MSPSLAPMLAMQQGWWRITRTEQLHAVLKCLHTRGVRERCLKQNLERYLETGTQAADMEKEREYTDL